MIFSKYKNILTVSGGTAAGNTPYMRGIITQLVITTITSSNTWSCTLKDREGDVIYQRDSETGTLNDNPDLPVGNDSAERFTIGLTSVGTNENISFIFKVLEQY